MHDFNMKYNFTGYFYVAFALNDTVQYERYHSYQLIYQNLLSRSHFFLLSSAVHFSTFKLIVLVLQHTAFLFSFTLAIQHDPDYLTHKHLYKNTTSCEH